MKNGFTLVEVLVVMAVTAFIGTILAAIFINTLRGSNKSKILSNIKQNGQAVLESMDKTIRGADDVVCGTSDTLVVVKDGKYTRFKLSLSQSGADNGWIKQDFPEQPQTDPKDDISVFLNTICTDPLGTDSIVAPQTFTDDNLQSGVSLVSGSFSRNSQSGSKESVTIQFQLGPAAGLPETIKNQIDPVLFQTTVALR